MGESASEVREKLGLTHDPQPYVPDADEPPDGFVYELTDRGLLIFFDDDQQVRTLSFIKPYAGQVDGIAVGDSSERLRELKGDPDRIWPGETTVAWLYDEDDFIRFDIDERSSKVVAIFL
jgi:hypothetical protein